MNFYFKIVIMFFVFSSIVDVIGDRCAYAELSEHFYLSKYRYDTRKGDWVIDRALIEVMRSDGVTDSIEDISYSYNQNGTLSEIKSSKDYQIKYGYSVDGVLKEVAYYGELQKQTYSYTYDGNGRLHSELENIYVYSEEENIQDGYYYGEDRLVTYIYENSELLKALVDDKNDGSIEGVITFSYNGNGQLSKKTSADNDGNIYYSITYAYNDAGNLVEQKIADNGTEAYVTYSYDNEDRKETERWGTHNNLIGSTSFTWKSLPITVSGNDATPAVSDSSGDNGFGCFIVALFIN